MNRKIEIRGGGGDKKDSKGRAVGLLTADDTQGQEELLDRRGNRVEVSARCWVYQHMLDWKGDAPCV